jgi:hypothetical protein
LTHRSALFVVYGVEIPPNEGGPPGASGGHIRCLHPWQIDGEGTLEALTYDYKLP